MSYRHFRAACVLAVALCLGALAPAAQADVFPPAGEDIILSLMTIEITVDGALVGAPTPIPIIGTFSAAIRFPTCPAAGSKGSTRKSSAWT